jgi:AAA domain
MSTPPAPPLSLRLRPASQLTPRPLRWLWRWRLAFGKLAILDGDPGLGKSLLALDLCARLSTGRPFPDGSPSPGPANSLILNGEDGAEDTIRHRLQALGADLDRVFILDRESAGGAEPLAFPAHTDFLDEALAQTRAQLAVIDPIMAFLDRSIVTSNDQVVRRALNPLAWLAERHQCVPLLVRHLNKTGGHRSVYRGGGSIGFLAACRSGWLLAADPYDPWCRVLAQVKNNLAPPQPSLAYRVPRQEDAPPVPDWVGLSRWTADQLLAGAAQAPPAIARIDRARDFLAAYLEDGTRTSRDIWKSGREQRLTRRTLERAKQDLHIRSVRVWADGKRLSYWLLPGQKLPESVPPESAPPDLEQWLAPLREQFPPSTPLDDL